MSTHDRGVGGNSVQSSEFESNFANRQNAVASSGDQSWGTSAAKHKE